MTDTKNVSLGTLYDFNKMIMATQNPLTKDEINEKLQNLEDWFNLRIDGYAMLLCRERYDFTVFHLYELQNENPPNIAAKELIEILQNRGDILSIEKENNTSTFEIWLKIDEEAFAYYLFACDDWVIEC